MKKTIALVLAAMMLMTLLLSGCGDSSESSKASTGDAANVDPNNPYANLDTSEEVNLIMYSVADEPLDMDEVLEMANERIKSALNATLELYFIPSAEYSVKYPRRPGRPDLYRELQRLPQQRGEIFLPGVDSRIPADEYAPDLGNSAGSCLGRDLCRRQNLHGSP